MALAALTLWVLLLVAAHPSVRADLPSQAYPLTGQGTWPSSLGRCLVSVDVGLDRLLSVQEREQTWRALHRFHLSWSDPRAQDAVSNATAAWYQQGGSAWDGCHLPCDSSLLQQAGCCDNLFLPQVDLPNLVAYDFQVNPPRWRIWVEPVTNTDGTTTNIVHWSVRLDGTWFSPYDFRAWPLEHQHLLVEMQPATSIADRVSLVLNSIQPLTTTPHTKGVDLAGWRINKVTQRLYDTSACHRRSNTTTWVYEFDPDTGAATQRSVNITNLRGLYNSKTVVTRVPESSCSSNNLEGTAQYGPYIIVVDTQVYRTQLYYVLIYIVPLVIVDLLVFVVYAMDRANVEARMGVIVTLVLALSALQFTYDFPPASYINVVQQMSLTSFVLFALVAICCIVTSAIARIHERKARHEAYLMAAGLKARASMELGSRPSMQLDSDSMFDFGTDQRNGAPRPSGLFFGNTHDPDAWGAPRVTANVPPRPPVGAPVMMPPLAEIDADRYPDMSIARPAGEAPGGPRQPGPVAEAAIWTTMTNWASRRYRYHFPSASPAQPGQAEQPSDGAEDPESPAVRAADMGGPDAFVNLPSSRPSQLQRGRKSVAKFVANVHATSRNVSKKISADEAYAQLIARRIDIVSSIVLFVCYVAVISAQLAISKDVGDHKLMLAGMSAPGNM